MSFPPTRHTLIQRLAAQGDERDWRAFLADYWGPVCRFAMRQGRLRLEDSEDAASLVFEAVIKNQLLARWVSHCAARLRTLLCGVTRNVLANRARVQSGRERLWREHAAQGGERVGLPLIDSLEAPNEEVDAFYAAWVEEIVQQAVEALLAEYHQAGKGDYFRVLYGRLCDGMTMPEVSQALGLSITAAENYHKHARKRLAERLEGLVGDHVRRYCPSEEAEAEFVAEWGRLGEHLGKHGGLEQAVRRSYEVVAAAGGERSKTRSLNKAVTRLSEVLAQ